MRASFLLLTALFAFAASAAEDDDVALVSACIEDRRYEAYSCISLISDPCQDLPGGSTTLGIVECLAQETAAWDVLLNRYYKELRATEDDPARSTIREAQRAWIAFRNADCKFAYEQFLGGTIRQVMGASCQLNRTAVRAIELYGYLRPGG